MENIDQTSSPQESKDTSGVKKNFYFQRRNQFKKKQCRFCLEKIKQIDWKQTQMLKPFTTETGRILPRKITGVCAKHQRQLSKAIKINRNLAILPYTTMCSK
ncbi:MAG: 30S ribosomal protein S18 [Elusimicrobiales bacterium]